MRRRGCRRGGEFASFLLVCAQCGWSWRRHGQEYIERRVLTCFIYSSGGITILDHTGKIEINNTFDERLKLLETDALPSVRVSLFGENKNRKFKD